jgi:hypothetical protein
MDTSLVIALAPAFTAGFAIQRLLEILDPILDRINGGEKKKIVLGIVSLLSGFGLASGLSVRVLSHLGITLPASLTFLDYLVTSLVISGGTEGFNSVLKFLNYKKEETKATAVAEKVNAANALALSRMTLVSDSEFNSGNAMDIAYKSVTKTTGSGEPVTPSATLAQYNAKDSDLPSIKNKILNNSSYGLPKYNRTMDPNALNGLTSGWTLQELADLIYDDSVPV